MKAISMVRSMPGQVIPDTTLARRFNARYAIGEPVQGASRTYPLLGPDSVFRHVDIQYVFHEERGNAEIHFSEPIWTENQGGGSFPAKSGMSFFSLFSATSKMSSPSFSLPAGPPREGGTCVAAGQGTQGLVRPGRGSAPGGARRDAQGRPFVCDLCYSTAGRYFMPNVGTAQAARLMWCLKLLEEDPSGTRLGEALVVAIDDVARRAHYGNLSARLGHEIGVWNRGHLTVPGYITGRKGMRAIPAEPTHLPVETGYATTFDFFEAHGVQDGDVVGFFRIHDSGDLNIGRKLETWKGYLAAWVHAAKAFPHLWFWMPVRTWTTKAMIPELQQASQLPNLTVRASTLYVGEAPPHIPGLSSSGVHVGSSAPEGQYTCPVTPGDRSSCAQEGCRACWLAPSMTPSYEEH